MYFLDRLDEKGDFCDLTICVLVCGHNRTSIVGFTGARHQEF